MSRSPRCSLIAVIALVAVGSVAVSHAAELFRGRCRMGECYWFTIEDRKLVGILADGELYKATLREWTSYHADSDYTVMDYDRPAERSGGEPATEYFYCSKTEPELFWKEDDGTVSGAGLDLYHVYGVTQHVTIVYYAGCHGIAYTDDPTLPASYGYVEMQEGQSIDIDDVVRMIGADR
jgi:hypothetical protein